MRFISAVHTDIGRVKDINQDSVLIKEAFTKKGNVVMAAVCDGMGGMAKGEVASASLVRELSIWFEKRLPKIIYQSETDRRISLQSEMDNLLNRVDGKISAYGNRYGDVCGTTVAGILIFGTQYYIANVGDSRVYLFDGKKARCLTKDQTVVQREIDRGRITPEEAETHPQRSMLLQCIGAGDGVDADYYHGVCVPDSLFLLCSDGLRHKVSEKEMERIFYPGTLCTEEDLFEAAVNCTEIVKQRKERDNISSILIKCEEDEDA